MKNGFKVLLALLFVGAMVFAIFFGKKGSDGRVNIRWVVDNSPSRQMEIKGFEEENPGISVELMGSLSGANTVLTQIAGNDPPDVFAVYEPAVLRIFMEKNALLDLKPYMDKYNVDLKDFWPALKPYMYFNEKVYGLPPNCGPFVLFYNKDMFDAKGMKYPSADWTWKELLDAAIKLTEVDDVKKTYKQFGLLSEDPMLFIWQNGGSMFSPDGRKCVVNSKEAKEGLRWYYNLRFKEHVMPKPSEMQNLAATGGWGGTLNLFASRKVAMFIQGRWMSMVFRKDSRLHWDIAPVPRGKHKVTMLASKVYVIPKNSKKLEEAAKFLIYQVSKRNQLMISKVGDGIPSRISIARSKEFLFDEEFPDEKSNKVYADEMKYARVPEFSPYADATQVYRAWYEELDKMYAGLQDSDQTLDKIAGRVNGLLKDRAMETK